MKCEEFRDKMVDMFDKNMPLEESVDMKCHMEGCSDCCELYKELQQVSESLKPKCSPVAKEKRERRFSSHWWLVAASVAIIIAIVSVGGMQFFCQPLKAGPFTLLQGIANVSNVKSFTMQLQMRTNSNDNFAYFDPHADFVDINMTQLVQGDSLFWRVEKENGRTVVYNGCEQYMWVPGVTYAIGSANSNFIEQFTELLNPESLLKIQQQAIEKSKEVTYKTRMNDSEAVITTETDVEYIPIALLKKRPAQWHKLFIENVFSLPDGLLRSFRVWMIYEGQEIELVKSVNIRYNLPIHKEILIRVPQGVEWMDLRTKGFKISSDERLQYPQAEDATQAAKRIMEALISGKTDEADEALSGYRQILPRLVEMYKSCKVSDFSSPKAMERYSGVFVFCTLTLPDGTSQQKHLPLRKDNELGIWILDGGL